MSMTLSHLLPNINFPASIAELKLNDLVDDSRKVAPGAAFVAVAGSSIDGRDFISQAIDAGASAVISESGAEVEISNDRGVPIVALPGLRHQVSALASTFYASPSDDLQVFGVTGTNGKTSTVSFLRQAFEFMGHSAATIGTLGVESAAIETIETGLTTPGPIDLQKYLAALRDADVTHVAMEVSSHAIDQGRVAATQFCGKAITNISRDHLDYHGSFEHYVATKTGFVCSGAMNKAINLDDKEGARIFEFSGNVDSATFYSVADTRADVYYADLRASLTGFSATLVSPLGRCELNSAVAGNFNLENLLCVASLIYPMCTSANELAQVLAALKPVKGRMQQLPTSAKKPNVFIDYAHTPDGLEKALGSLRPYVGNGRLILVFGCGGDRDKGKRPQMGEIACRLADRVYVTSDNPRMEDPETIVDDVLAGMKNFDCIIRSVDRGHAIKSAISSANAADTVLIAGKGHENYQLIAGEKLHFDDYECALNAMNSGEAH